ncbi:MAG: hypothetical protein AAB479_01865 [Patescibacteria group bacterium]
MTKRMTVVFLFALGLLLVFGFAPNAQAQSTNINCMRQANGLPPDAGASPCNPYRIDDRRGNSYERQYGYNNRGYDYYDRGFGHDSYHPQQSFRRQVGDTVLDLIRHAGHSEIDTRAYDRIRGIDYAYDRENQRATRADYEAGREEQDRRWREIKRREAELETQQQKPEQKKEVAPSEEVWTRNRTGYHVRIYDGGFKKNLLVAEMERNASGTLPTPSRNFVAAFQIWDLEARPKWCRAFVQGARSDNGFTVEIGTPGEKCEEVSAP